MWAEDATLWLNGRRAIGWDFDRAWAQLMREYPPDWRKEFRVGSDGTFEGELAQRECEEWLRAVFEDAYSGRPSRMQLVSAALVTLEPNTKARARAHATRRMAA